jgi:hypothetical protein
MFQRVTPRTKETSGDISHQANFQPNVGVKYQYHSAWSDQ